MVKRASEDAIDFSYICVLRPEWAITEDGQIGEVAYRHNEYSTQTAGDAICNEACGAIWADWEGSSGR